jgi:hypothetical protein
LAKCGTGLVNVVNDKEIEGIDTLFKSEVLVGDSIKILGSEVILKLPTYYR